MRKQFLKITSVLIPLAVFFSACAKEEPEPEDPANGGNTVPTTPPYFAWTNNGTTTHVADSSHCYVGSNVIFAFKNGNSNSLEIRLSAMAVGAYPVNSVSGNELEYQLGAAHYTGSGTVNISASPAGKISGSFSCALSGGTLSSMTGTFADVPKR